MSTQSRALRRQRVRAVREEGAQAFRSGRHCQTNPYPPSNMDHYQWTSGYDAAEQERNALVAELPL